MDLAGCEQFVKIPGMKVVEVDENLKNLIGVRPTLLTKWPKRGNEGI